MTNCWEVVADNLKKAGCSLGWVSAIDSKGRTIWIVDAHWLRKAVRRAGRRNPKCVRGTGKGNTPVRGEFGLVKAVRN
jgi:hypothetical protein